MGNTPGKKGGGSRKIGRNKMKCARYKNELRYQKNKDRKAKKQAKIHAKAVAKRAAREAKKNETMGV